MEERLIRKYENRRLYDTRTSRYVTLEDLLEVFASDDAVRVVDAVSGEDLTKRILAQAILFEEARRRTQIIPIELLRGLLRKRTIARERRGGLSDRSQDQTVGSAATGGTTEGAQGELADLRRRLQALESQLGKPAKPSHRRAAARRAR